MKLLPTFPDLAVLEECHLPAIQELTSRFPSYSDFNAVSLWTWSAAGPYRVGQLFRNLVVEFRDYMTGETFLSFIGDSQVSETALILLGDSHSTDERCYELRLVPETAARSLVSDSRFVVTLDPDARDYLYSPIHTLPLVGRALRPLRQELAQFERLSAAVGGVAIVEADPKVLQSNFVEFLAIFDRWKRRDTDGAKYSTSERLAIEHLCQTIDVVTRYAQVLLHLAVSDDDIFGFAVSEVLPDRTAVAHFLKSDGRIQGLSSRFFHEQVKLAEARGLSSINWEQDLGVPGLRKYKERLNPSGYLNKYSVQTTDRRQMGVTV